VTRVKRGEHRYNMWLMTGRAPVHDAYLEDGDVKRPWVRDRKRTLNITKLVLIAFASVAGGPYGFEDSIGAAGRVVPAPNPPLLTVRSYCTSTPLPPPPPPPPPPHYLLPLRASPKYYFQLALEAVSPWSHLLPQRCSS